MAPGYSRATPSCAWWNWRHCASSSPRPQAYYSLVEPGTPAQLRFDALPGESLPATVARLIAVGQPAARTFRVQVELPNPQHRYGNAEKCLPWHFSARLGAVHARAGLRESSTSCSIHTGASCPGREAPNKSALPYAPGTSVDVTLMPAAGAAVTTVPRDALVRRPDGSALLWLAREQDGVLSAVPLPVQPGRAVGDRLQVSADGLRAGAQVVVHGNERLRPGQALRVVDGP